MTVPTRKLIETVAQAVIAHAEELTALDQAIGDGDHGVNMRRGFEAVLAELDSLSAKTLPDALKQVGMTLVMKVGGASGPLYGTLFSELGKAMDAEPTFPSLASALAVAIEKLKARGKSDVGSKTMLDVLVPVQTVVASGDIALIEKTALEAAEATVPMRAVRGRASFLGDRSIGHMDPGARSSQLIISTVCSLSGASS